MGSRRRSGAGHYVKMVHNGIEYSMMQGYAEGFELMAKSDYKLDLAKIADLWMHGSVVRSWLLELAAGALKEDPRLEQLKGYVQDSGEGRWMIADAIEKDVPVPTLTTALFTRFRSRQRNPLRKKCWPRCGMPSAAMRSAANAGALCHRIAPGSKSVPHRKRFLRSSPVPSLFSEGPAISRAGV